MNDTTSPQVPRGGDDLVSLPVRLHVLDDPFGLILDRCRGKTVLNVGAAGGVKGYLPDFAETWLHHRIMGVASDVVGVDIDADGIAYARKHGYEILHGDCEEDRLGRSFDVVVMSDVIEHLNAPGRALRNLSDHLSKDGCLIVTTRNGSAGNVLLRAAMRRPVNVYWDHMACYLPEHLQVLAERMNLQVNEVHMFDHFDRRSIGTCTKSVLFRAMTKLAPRLASSFLAVLEPAGQKEAG